MKAFISMKNILWTIFLIFCLFKGWQDVGLTAGVTPLFDEPYVAIYGRNSCGFTKRMINNLKQENINYRYFIVDEKTVANSLHQRMEQAGISTRRYNLPVVDVNASISVRPDFQRVAELYYRGL